MITVFQKKAQRTLWAGGGLKNRAACGFSLVELLVVVAMIGLMASFALTGFKDIGASRGVGQAASDVKGILELARSEAVTKQTFVWAAFREATNSGILEIQMALAGSADGTANAAGTNLVPISRVVHAKNVGLANASTLRATASVTYTDLFELLGNTSGITYTNLSQSRFTNTTITFTPRGEAMAKGSPLATHGFTPLIGIGIVPSRGDQKDPQPKSDSAVVLDGSTGMSTIVRCK